jgi:hypothetical protein
MEEMGIAIKEDFILKIKTNLGHYFLCLSILFLLVWKS